MRSDFVTDTNEEYHSKKEYLSSSGVKKIAKKSVQHFVRCKPMECSKAFDIGTAVHTAVLEPFQFDRDVYCIDAEKEAKVIADIGGARPKSTKKYQDWLESQDDKANGRIILNSQEAKTVRAMASNILNHPICSKYLNGSTNEKSFYIDDYMGIPFKIRPDGFNHGIIFDVKTCQDSSPKGFISDVFKHGYDIQEVVYSEALEADGFLFFAVEKEYPHVVEVYSLSETTREFARIKAHNAIEDYKFFLEEGVEVGYRSEKRNELGIIEI